MHRIDVTQPTPVVEAGDGQGFSMVGGFGVGPAGELLVVDDPALLDPAEPLGTGRMVRVGLPAAHATGPRRRTTAPRLFTVAGDGTLPAPPARSRPQRRVGRVPGRRQRHARGRPRRRRRYTLSARAVQAGITGIAEAHRFVVDTVAPAIPVIDRPAQGAAAPLRPWFAFDAEEGATFACRFDDETDFTACSPGRTRTFTENGSHTLTIRATDRAGNESPESAPRAFTVDAALAIEMPLPWGPGPVTHRGSTLYAAGLHLSTGAIVDPAGRVWIADHNAGFCRVTAVTDEGPGHVEHPQTPGAAGPRTCLGGLLPEAGTGPDAAGQPTFVDPTPAHNGSGDEVVLIPDGASASSELVRVDWNPDTQLFEYRDTISTIGARTRPVASSLGPDGSVYVVFQRSGTVQRIARPAAADPVVQVVGITADGRRANAVAAGLDDTDRTTVWIGEDAGIGVLRPNAVAPPTSQPSGFTLPAGAAVSALISDLGRDHLWVGTANGTTAADAGIDTVDRFTTSTPGGAPQRGYATGYSMIGGFGLRPDGVLYVADDPALLDPAEPIGTGRLFHVGLPAAHILRGPLAADGTESPDRAFTNTRDADVHRRRRGRRGVQPARPRHHRGVGRMPGRRALHARLPAAGRRVPPRRPLARRRRDRPPRVARLHRRHGRPGPARHHEPRARPARRIVPVVRLHG